MCIPEKAQILIPNSNPLHMASCNQCGAPPGPEVDLSRCAHCMSAWYCSRQCQQAAWDEHKLICKESRSKFRKQLFRGAVKTNALSSSMQRDHTEQFGECTSTSLYPRTPSVSSHFRNE